MSITATVAGDETFLFCPSQSTKNGEILRILGKISYSCLAELLKKKLKALVFVANLFGVSLRDGGQQLLPMLRYLIGFLRGMGDGIPKIPRMATLRTA